LDYTKPVGGRTGKNFGRFIFAFFNSIGRCTKCEAIVGDFYGAVDAAVTWKFPDA
jgi:hypothetical protein